MSILLDALKKSEAQRRLGEIPTLQSQVSLEQERDGERHAWIPFALMLFSAVFMSWTGITQFGADDPGRAAAPPAREANIAASVESATEAGNGAAAGAEAQGIPSRTRARNTAGTPIQDYVAENPPDAARENQPRPSRRTTARPSSEKPGGLAVETDAGAAQQSRNVAHVEVAPNANAASPQAADPGPGTNTQSASPAGTEPGTYAPQTISYWQLPQALREELGEIRISVLVYAANPADRFLLVNGNRLTEQQAADSGAVLEEIQRDRAVFSYRNYRFHVKN